MEVMVKLNLSGTTSGMKPGASSLVTHLLEKERLSAKKQKALSKIFQK